MLAMPGRPADLRLNQQVLEGARLRAWIACERVSAGLQQSISFQKGAPAGRSAGVRKANGFASSDRACPSCRRDRPDLSAVASTNQDLPL